MGKYNIGKCRVCGHKIPENGYICPNCGEDHRSFFEKNKLMIIIMIVILGAVIYFYRLLS